MLRDQFQPFDEEDRIHSSSRSAYVRFNQRVGVVMDTLVEASRDAVSQIGVDAPLDARHVEPSTDWKTEAQLATPRRAPTSRSDAEPLRDMRLERVS